MRILLLLIFFAVALETQAQTNVYHPFPDSDAVWNMTHLTSNPFSSSQYSYFLNGDTIIAGKIYHTLFHSPPKTYAGSIRQDIANRKVFYVSPDSTSEAILYDFNLSTGDTGYSFFDTNHYNPFIVQSIDSVLVGNDYRKAWLLNSNWNSGSTYWSDGYMMEGIGSRDILRYPFCGQTYYSGGGSDWFCTELDCFKMNGLTLYPDSNTECNIYTNVKLISKESLHITLSPNPFHSCATINGIENAHLTIYNTFGELVQQQQITNQSTVINRNSLADGIYFYDLVNDKGEVARGKFVVN